MRKRLIAQSKELQTHLLVNYLAQKLILSLKCLAFICFPFFCLWEKSPRLVMMETEMLYLFT